jgi:geranylgeranyl pyrophosphate synthase
VEKQLVRRVLCEQVSDAGYRQYLISVLERWAWPDTALPPLEGLPMVVCEACGGTPRQAVPVGAAWRLFRLAAKLIDDVQDGDAGEDAAETLNSGVALTFFAQLVLQTLTKEDVSPDRVRRLCQALAGAGLVASAGQHADISGEQLDPDRWLEVAEAKSGALLGWGSWAGAFVARAEPDVAQAYLDYGRNLGVLLQIADDYNDIWGSERAETAVGANILPVVYALSVSDAPERARLRTLLADVRKGSSGARRLLYEFLRDAGGQAFMLVVARVHYDRAEEALDRARAGDAVRERLLDMLRKVFPALHIGG